ncbi:hypothetical protein WJX72_008062 [[Myrmecia] bisecta]|uniref:Uncharacterized protein n=1 Tax=[Myrmecia] bisecta TaxID=41462 RepID=A0AAW1P1J8_9CHLO
MAFITQHKQLVACHLLDLFSDRLWQLVDPAWVAAIGPLSTAELKAHSAGRRLAVGVSQKKQYEVRLTAALVARVAQAAGARFVVEFGCGQGHLALSLALQAGLELVLRRWYADVNPRELSVKSARKRRTLSSSRGYLRPYAAGEQPTPGSQAEALSAQQGSVAGVGEASSPQGEAAGIQQAPADLGCPKQCTSEQLHQVWQEAVLPRCAAFRTLWLLRQVLAPVLETLIVVDRLAYLLEGSVRHSTAAQHSAAQHSSSSSGPVAAAPSDPGCGQTAHAGTAVFVSAVFDPATSPRNIALIALRSAPALPDCPMALGSSIAN